MLLMTDKADFCPFHFFDTEIQCDDGVECHKSNEERSNHLTVVSGSKSPGASGPGTLKGGGGGKEDDFHLRW